MGKFIISFRYHSCVFGACCWFSHSSTLDRVLGVSNHLYHFGAVYIGSIFGIMTLIGMLLLTSRRLTLKNVRRLSSASDIFVNLLLLIIIFMGCYSTLVTNAVTPDFDYRQTISIWFRHLFTFSPDAMLMNHVPLSFKCHILLDLQFWHVGHLQG